MKKIGILYGHDSTFAEAFISRVNEKKEKGIRAEPVRVDKVMQAAPTPYAVIIDQISQQVPFYRAYLKNAALSGTAVINNPFWQSADEHFFANALAVKLGIPVPKTVLLPSNQQPPHTHAASFRNLAFPLDWLGIFEYVKFPAGMKPLDRVEKRVYKVNNLNELFAAHNETGHQVMILQEEIAFSNYFRCFCVGKKAVRIIQYEPDAAFSLPSHSSGISASTKLLATMKRYALQLSVALGYDFTTVDFALRDGIPYAIDMCDPAPEVDTAALGEETVEWVVEAVASMAIKRAKALKAGTDTLTWGTFVKNAVGT